PARELRRGHRTVAGGVQVLHLGRELGWIDDKAPELAGGTGVDAVIHEDRHGDLARDAFGVSRRPRAHRGASRWASAATRACLRALLTYAAGPVSMPHRVARLNSAGSSRCTAMSGTLPPRR